MDVPKAYQKNKPVNLLNTSDQGMIQPQGLDHVKGGHQILEYGSTISP
jgi:hypothetical protein